MHITYSAAVAILFVLGLLMSDNASEAGWLQDEQTLLEENANIRIQILWI